MSHRSIASTASRCLLLALVLVTSTACGEGEPAASPETIAAGGKHFLSTCATCHGADANGLPKLGKGLRMNEFVKTNSDEEMVAFLKTGRQASHPLNTTGIDMPPKGGNPALTDQDLEAIVAYLRTLQ